MLSSRVRMRSAWSLNGLLAQRIRHFLSVPPGPRELKVVVMGEPTHKDPALSRLALLPAEATIVTHGPTLDAMSLEALRSANVLFCATGTFVLMSESQVLVSQALHFTSTDWLICG